MSFTHTASEFTDGKYETGIQIICKIHGQYFRFEFPQQRQEKCIASNFDSQQLFRFVFVSKLKSPSVFSCTKNKETLHQRNFVAAIPFATAPCFVESTIFHVLIGLEDILAFIVNCVLN